MANSALRVAENVAGDFFVDSSCIDLGQGIKAGYKRQNKPSFIGDPRRRPIHQLLFMVTR